MKSLLACVLAIVVALVALTVAVGYFQQCRSLQAQLASTTKELQPTKSDLERPKREAGLSYHFHDKVRCSPPRDKLDTKSLKQSAL